MKTFDKAVKITQDGIGRLSRTDTPKHITSIYTDGLQTCMAFIFVSAKGVSLIHATRILEKESFLKELDWHGSLLYWTIVMNPIYYPLMDFGGEEHIKFIANYLFLMEDERSKLKYLKNPRGFIDFKKSVKGIACVTLTGKITVDIKPSSEIPFPDQEKRLQINVVNSFFTLRRDPKQLGANERIPADFQFDGKKYLPNPRLMKTKAQRNKLISMDPCHNEPGSKSYTKTMVDMSDKLYADKESVSEYKDILIYGKKDNKEKIKKESISDEEIALSPKHKNPI